MGGNVSQISPWCFLADGLRPHRIYKKPAFRVPGEILALIKDVPHSPQLIITFMSSLKRNALVQLIWPTQNTNRHWLCQLP